MTWNIKRHNDGLYLYCNLIDIENWANYFYDLKYGCRYDSLNYTQLTDLLYEAENSCCLKFGALTGQDEEINHDSKTEILKAFNELEPPDSYVKNNYENATEIGGKNDK